MPTKDEIKAALKKLDYDNQTAARFEEFVDQVAELIGGSYSDSAGKSDVIKDISFQFVERTDGIKGVTVYLLVVLEGEGTFFKPMYNLRVEPRWSGNRHTFDDKKFKISYDQYKSWIELTKA